MIHRGSPGARAQRFALFLPARRQRPLQLLQHERLIRPPFRDHLDDVWRQQSQPQNPAYVALGDALRLPDIADGAVRSLIEHALPAPCPRRASALTSVPSGCGFELGTISLPSGATMRLRPPGRWKRIGMRTTSVEPSRLIS